tara:strand:+ start:364 stop:591 length:228 start_codon:yes stop_codon:yes gene_type:complete
LCITKGEKEVSKPRSDLFFRIKQGEFIAFSDGKDKRVRFALQPIQKEKLKQENHISEADLTINFKRIYNDILIIG